MAATAAAAGTAQRNNVGSVALREKRSNLRVGRCLFVASLEANVEEDRVACSNEA